jgi:hypothetical protein
MSAREGDECRPHGLGIDLAGKPRLAGVERDGMRAVAAGRGQSWSSA